MIFIILVSIQQVPYYLNNMIVIQQFDGYKWLSKEFYMKNDFTFLLFQFFSFFIIDCGLFK